MNRDKCLKKSTTQQLINDLRRLECMCPNPIGGNCCECQNTGYCAHPDDVHALKKEIALRYETRTKVQLR